MQPNTETYSTTLSVHHSPLRNNDTTPQASPDIAEIIDAISGRLLLCSKDVTLSQTPNRISRIDENCNFFILESSFDTHYLSHPL